MAGNLATLKETGGKMATATLIAALFLAVVGVAAGILFDWLYPS